MIAERQRNASSAPRSVEAARKGIAARRQSWGAGPEVGQIHDTDISGRSGPIGVRHYLPISPARARILFVHGGGWIAGTLQDYDPFVRAICHATQCEVIAVDYRLAPEHPFPAALEDCEDVLMSLARQGDGLPLLIAGDSAGGNLAAVVALTDAGRAELSGQILLSPVTDCDDDTESYRRCATGYLLDKAEMQWLWQQYVPSGERDSPRVSPLRACSLAGAPQAWVVGAEFDVLCDDARLYARKLAWHGVRVRYSEFAGMTHNFGPMMNVLEDARVMLAQMNQVVGKMVTGEVF